MTAISIVISEPATDYGVGSYEWRMDPIAGEREFRSLRGGECDTSLWHGVEVPATMTADEITDYVDSIYWDGEPFTTWGMPARIHRAVV